MTTKSSFSLDGEGEDAGEKFGLRSRLDIFNLNLEKMLGILTHLHPLTPGKRKRIKKNRKDEILTASEYEASG